MIYPESHYGRDALVGVGLFLSHYVAQSKKMTELKSTYPPYFISKNKMTLSPDMDVDKILEGLKEICHRKSDRYRRGKNRFCTRMGAFTEIEY